MDGDALQAFQKELSCAVCRNTFLDAVTIDCGHSFCRPCLYLSCEESQTLPGTCPACCKPTQQGDLKSDVPLKSLVALARKASLWRLQSLEEHKCGPHKETRHIFCLVVKDLLCVQCSRSQEHESHSHHSVERASEEQGEAICKLMPTIWNKIQEIQRNIHKNRRLIFAGNHTAVAMTCRNYKYL